MKKATKTTVKKATKKTAAKKAVKKVAAKKAVKKVVAKKAPAPSAAKAAKKPVKKTAAKSPAKKKASLPSKTTIVASVDVGFGNALFLRGDGPGLSWSKGVPLDCKNDSTWEIAMTGLTESFDYKLLINDECWDIGDNSTATIGKVNKISPRF